MAKITNALVTAELAKLKNWFGPHDTISGVTDNSTDDVDEFTFLTDSGSTVPITYLELVDSQAARQRIIKVESQILGSAVASDNYGPLELDSSEDNLPWEIINRPRISFVTSLGGTVDLYYHELKNQETRNRIVNQSAGQVNRFEGLKDAIAALNTKADAITSSAVTQANWAEIIADLDAITNEYRGEAR